MSYPYDSNPWDDNYSQPAGSGQQQSNPGYGGSNAAGYSNPMNQFADPVQQQPDQYYQNQYEDQYNGYQDQQEQQQQQGGGEQEQKANPSALSRFLRQHVPIYGTVADTISGINLPFLDALFQHVNRDLLVSKIFYFFFYSAFGSLFPLMGVYFKQQGMNPAQVGILTGIRPFIEIFSAPFWHSLAERFHKSKELLLFSLLSWIVFTYSLAHIRPPASECIAYNDSHYILYTPYSANDLGNIDLSNEGPMKENEMFMSKVPAQMDEIAKVKDDILVGEQNRRRRRKRRQAPGVERLAYTIDRQNQVDEGYGSEHLDLELDLENDFDDRVIGRDSESSKPEASLNSPFFEMNGADADAPEYDEVEQMYSKGSRVKRHTRRNEDDVLGESDDPDQEESNQTDEEEEKVNGSSRPKDREVAEGEEVEQDNRQEQEEEGEGGDAVDTSGGKRGRGTAKHNQQQTGTGLTPAAAGTSTMANEKPFDESGENTGRQQAVNKTGTKRIYRQRHKTPPTHIVGMSPITVEYAVNYKKEKHGSQFVTPMFSTVVYKLDDVKEVFFLLLLLISLGEFFSAPALTLADSATLSNLGENTDLYGRQRMFGSFSWAITLLLVGMALDNATSIADHPCGPHIRERSYTVCFVIFSLLMACAFMTATQFKFNYPKGTSSGGSQTLITSTTADSNTVVTTTATANNDDLYASTQPRSIFNTAPPVNAPPPSAQGAGKEKFEYLDKWKSAVFAQRTKELPEWVNVFRQFGSTLHLTYLFITWFLGCGVGLVFTFLFWHLQDVGGTPTLFGICSVINHISEILAYFFSFNFIKRFGHTKVLSVGLACNVVRFIYVAFLTNPYYALPFELVQGITHAACFAACCSYISHKSKPELRTSTQGVMQGLHHGIGRACGALLGGYMINAIGSRASFCIYGLLSGCVLAGFLYVRKKASQMESEEEMKVDDSEALGGYGAPQGVPSAIPGKIGVSQPQATTVASSDIDYQW